MTWESDVVGVRKLLMSLADKFPREKRIHDQSLQVALWLRIEWNLVDVKKPLFLSSFMVHL